MSVRRTSEGAAEVDKIIIKDLTVDCVIGVLPQERQEPQPLRADIEMELPLRPAGQSGDLGQSVDYAAVAARVREHAVNRKAFLLEELGADLCDLILGEFKVNRVCVRLRKPCAVTHAAYAAVEMTWPER